MLSNAAEVACNRLRLSAAGALYTRLGHEEFTDLGSIIRRQGEVADPAAKPKSHEFGTTPVREPVLKRQMSVLGG